MVSKSLTCAQPCWNGTTSRNANRNWIPGDRHPQLLQQLHEVAVEALLLALAAALGVLGFRGRVDVSGSDKVAKSYPIIWFESAR